MLRIPHKCHQYVQEGYIPIAFFHASHPWTNSASSHSISTLGICFMSLMGDTTRPSCDGSLPIDFNTLSRNFLHCLGTSIPQWKVFSLSASIFHHWPCMGLMQSVTNENRSRFEAFWLSVKKWLVIDCPLKYKVRSYRWGLKYFTIWKV